MRGLIKKYEAVSNGMVDIYRKISEADKKNTAVAELLSLCVSMRKNLSLSETAQEAGAIIAGLNGTLEDIHLCELAIQSFIAAGFLSQESADPVLLDCKSLRKMINKKIENQ